MKRILTGVALVFVLPALMISCRPKEDSANQKANSSALPAATATPTVMTGSGGNSINENAGASQNNNSGEVVSPAVKSELSTATRELLGVRLRGESKAAAELLADDYKNTKPDGAVEDRTQYLANLKPFKDFEGFIFDQFKVISLQGDTAVVSGLVQAWNKDKKSLYSRFTWTFVRRQGKWLLQSSQETEMKDDY